MPTAAASRRLLTDLPDTAVIRHALAGTPNAFAELMQRHNRRAFRVAWSLLRNRAEAEDVVQEAYLKAFTGLSRFDGTASFATWLTRIVVNEALMRRRRWQRHLDDALGSSVVPLHGAAGAEPADLRDSPETASSRAELRARLERAVAALPEDFRLVFVLRAVEGLSVEETAMVLALPEETVRSRLFRARRRLRAMLERQLADAFQELLPFAGARCAALGARVLERLSAAGLLRPP